jgi:hypothetical protein
MKKLFISLIIAVVLAVGLYQLYPQIAIYPLLKYYVFKNDFPLTHQTPVEKQIEQRIDSTELPYKLSTKWFEISTPWKLSNTKLAKSLTLYQFPNEKVIIISERKNKFLDSFLKGNDIESLKVKSVLGENHLQSEYDFEKLCLYTTPDQVSLFSSAAELTKVLTMVLMKGMLLGDKIYSFTVKDYKVFQFIKTDTGSLNTNIVHIFDNKDQCFEINFLNINQDQVDSILASIQMIV